MFLFCRGGGQYGEVCRFASTLCKYDLRKGGGGGGVYCWEVCVYVLFCIGVLSGFVLMFVVYLVIVVECGLLFGLGVCLCNWSYGCCTFCMICDTYSLRCS